MISLQEPKELAKKHFKISAFFFILLHRLDVNRYICSITKSMFNIIKNSYCNDRCDQLLKEIGTFHFIKHFF